jgi:hypothetical protein
MRYLQTRQASLKILFIACIATASVVAMSFRPVEKKTKLIIHFANYVGDQKLVLDTVTYHNQLGQPFTVTNFKYYISNISLKGKDDKEYFVKDSYFLIRQDDESTWVSVLDDVPPGIYKSISFVIGVDSLHNCNGAQSGTLDPANGMFWAWTSGYIFLKLEGKADASNSPGHIFEYHIGGYKEPNNFIRKATVRLSSFGLQMLTGKTTSLTIKTDVSEILKNPNTIDFSKLSSVTDFHHAAEIADNYTDIFTFMSTSNEW